MSQNAWKDIADALSLMRVSTRKLRESAEKMERAEEERGRLNRSLDAIGSNLEHENQSLVRLNDAMKAAAMKIQQDEAERIHQESLPRHLVIH